MTKTWHQDRHGLSQGKKLGKKNGNYVTLKEVGRRCYYHLNLAPVWITFSFHGASQLNTHTRRDFQELHGRCVYGETANFDSKVNFSFSFMRDGERERKKENEPISLAYLPNAHNSWDWARAGAGSHASNPGLPRWCQGPTT